MTSTERRDLVRTVADAVLYEGYLLYPYRSSSKKNRSRWQFGVLGPPGASAAGVGEEPSLASQCIISGDRNRVAVRICLRFLQLQVRSVERADTGGNTYSAVEELVVDGKSWLSWDEAVDHEITLDPVYLDEIADSGGEFVISVEGGTQAQELYDRHGQTKGRVVRTRCPLRAVITVTRERHDPLVRLGLIVENTTEPMTGSLDKGSAISNSFIGAHLILSAMDGQFISLLEPRPDAEQLVASCQQRRCFPVLAGRRGDTDTVLISPIILYDYPEVAEQSDGALFDSTEIDEILTLRVMTLTDEEKQQARATDPLAAQIIDRCERMSPAAMAQMHGILRDPHALDGPAQEGTSLGQGTDMGTDSGLLPELTDAIPWWEPEADTAVRPDVDAVLVDGIRVAKGTMVRLHPSRRADAQDLFFNGQLARVTTVHGDVDGQTHVGVVLVEDPASEMHEWYGRYLYFAPNEVEPLAAEGAAVDGEEGRS